MGTVDGFRFLRGRANSAARPYRSSLSKTPYFLKLAIPLVLIFVTSLYLFESRPDHVVEIPAYKHLYNTAASGKKEVFVKQVLENDIDGEYHIEPLREFCQSEDRVYQPGLIVKCDHPWGGFGNVKNIMLNCIRFAFEAGATGFVLPDITRRLPEDLRNLTSGVVLNFDYLFDQAHFNHSFINGCPEVKLYQSEAEVLEEFPDVNGIGEVENPLHTWQIRDRKYLTPGGTIFANIESWREAFDEWLNNKDINFPFSEFEPIVVTIKFPLLRFPMNYDAPEFITTFGRLIQVRFDIRRIAATVLFALSEKYSLDINPAAPIEPGKFYGAHLRTAIDTVKVGWPQYDKQAPNYLAGARKHKLSTIYLATGNASDVDRFTKSANKQGAQIAMKDELLNQPGFESEKEEMDALNWDQQGMVDYEVLLRCSQFGGMFESSFAWAVSNRRHVVQAGGTWDMIYEGHQGVNLKSKGPEGFKDTLSTIYGPKDLGKLRWQFPLGLWP